ncbi:MAG: YhgE/Pip family protein [Culicoidibacterales bacterium]
MKGILEILRTDFKKLRGNYAAIIIIFALALLPSMYAWFNIIASWDPYGNTGQIKVAVVNEDSGTTFQDKPYNIGEEVIAKLKTNDQLDWQFVDKSDADSGLNTGEYYAMITLPTNFSKDVLSVTTDAVQQARITYTSNDKLNAIAPKITEKGATSLQSQINETIIGTISQVLLEAAQFTGEELQGAIPKLEQAQTTIQEIQTTITQATSTLTSAQQAAEYIHPVLVDVQQQLPNITNLVEQAQSTANSISQFLKQLNSVYDTVLPEITTSLQLVSTWTNDVADLLEKIQTDITNPDNKAIIVESIDGMIVKIQTAQSFVTTLQNALTTLQTQHPNLQLTERIQQLADLNQQLSAVSTKLSAVREAIITDSPTAQTLLGELVEMSRQIATTAKTLADVLPNEVFTGLTSITADLQTTVDQVIVALNGVHEVLPQVDQAIQASILTLEQAEITMDDVQKIIPDVQEMLTNVQTGLSKVLNGSAIDLLDQILSLNIGSQIEFLEQPVVIDNETLYPVANYGTAMTPFYSILSLWVGCLLMVSILSVDKHGEHDYKPYQVFFGKYAIFGMLAMIQAFIVMAGDIWILNVQPASIPLFIGVGVFSSFVFSFFVYTCVSVFGAVGKVIGILLLVLQIAGSGGTFPIQLTPEFFQSIYPFLPFTHAIGATREALGGVVWPVFWYHILILSSYIGMTLLIGLALKKPLNKLLAPFAHKFHESELGE